MNTVPNMISTKDLAYFKDMFNWHFVIAKKAQHYECMIQDKEILEECQKLSKMHLEICNSIIKILGGSNE